MDRASEATQWVGGSAPLSPLYVVSLLLLLLEKVQQHQEESGFNVEDVTTIGDSAAAADLR